jgi:hypothetical protein
MKSYLIILCSIFTLKTSGQGGFDKSVLSAATEKVVLEIKQLYKVSDNIYEETPTGIKKKDILAQLLSVASKDELFNLTKHPSGVVRCYSFWALSRKPDVDLLPILINHLSDTANIQVLFGDEGWREKVGDFMIEVVTPNRVDVASSKLDSSQMTRLDSILIYIPNDLNAKANAITRAQPTDKLYPRLRELVVNDHNQPALVTLAKYRKQQDISLILNNREEGEGPNAGYFYTYRAIGQFPCPDFMPILRRNLQNTYEESHHYSNEWRELYRAIAAYRNPAAVELLKSPFTKVKSRDIREYHLNFVFAAVQGSTDPIFDDLKWMLWEDGSRIGLDEFKYLSLQSPQRAFMLAKKSLFNIYAMEISGFRMSFDDNTSLDSLPGIMLNLICQKDSVLGLEIIRTNLKQADVHVYPIFSRKAAEICSPSFLNPLFERLDREDNPWIYLETVKALIAYKNDGINKKILESRQKNRALRTGWGGRDLDSLLKENNIN